MTLESHNRSLACLPILGGTARAHPRKEVSEITRRQVKAVTVWLGMATAVVVLLQALTQLAEMFMHR